MAQQKDLTVVTHAENRGYGAALISAFAYALAHDVDVLVTMDCDGQHEPSRIPVLLEALDNADIVSGSRYLRDFRQDNAAPAGLPDPGSFGAGLPEGITEHLAEQLSKMPSGVNFPPPPPGPQGNIPAAFRGGAKRKKK